MGTRYKQGGGFLGRLMGCVSRLVRSALVISIVAGARNRCETIITRYHSVFRGGLRSCNTT